MACVELRTSNPLVQVNNQLCDLINNKSPIVKKSCSTKVTLDASKGCTIAPKENMKGKITLKEALLSADVAIVCIGLTVLLNGMELELKKYPHYSKEGLFATRIIQAVAEYLGDERLTELAQAKVHYFKQLSNATSYALEHKLPIKVPSLTYVTASCNPYDLKELINHLASIGGK